MKACGEAGRVFTFECWVRRRVGGRAQRLAEMGGEGWGWTLGVDERGELAFVWRAAGFERRLAAKESAAALFPEGEWRHVALVFFDRSHTGEAYAEDYSLANLYVTPEGEVLPRCVASVAKFATPAWPEEASAVRVTETTTEAGLELRDLALHARALPPGDFVALGGVGLPEGVSVDAEFEDASLGRAFALDAETVVFTEAPLAHHQNYYFAFRVRGAKGRRLRFLNLNGRSMMTVAFVSENGGRTWARPSEGMRREVAVAYQGLLEFAHRFASDEALVASCPLVTARAVDAWLDAAPQRSGARVRRLGTTSGGRPLRVAELGDESAPLVYLQGGQHSMAERWGWPMMEEVFLALALAGAGRVRVAVLPVFNLDSPYVTATAADTNTNRLWGTGATHASVRAVEAWLEAEAARTGVAAAFDWHTGVVWKEHALCRNGAPLTELERAMEAEGLVWQSVDWSRGPAEGLFGKWALGLRGVRMVATVELALLETRLEGETRVVDEAVLREQGRRFGRALAKVLTS